MIFKSSEIFQRTFIQFCHFIWDTEDCTCSPSYSLISRGWREKTETTECCLFHVLQALAAALLQALLKLASFSVQIAFLQTGIRDKELLSLALRIFFFLGFVFFLEHQWTDSIPTPSLSVHQLLMTLWYIHWSKRHERVV